MLAFARWILAITFVASGLLKGVNLDATDYLVRQYAGLINCPLTPALSFGAAALLCMLEVFLGFASMKKDAFVLVQPIVLLLLSCFTIVTYINAISPLARIESCGCFGEMIHLNYINKLDGITSDRRLLFCGLAKF